MEIKAVDPEFVRVWSRVKGEAPEPREEGAREGQSDFFTGKIRAELERRRVYLALGLDGCARLSLARANRLRTAWFFCSGQRFWPTRLGPRQAYPSRGDAIRSLYHSEELSQRDYLTAREGCGSEMLRDMLTQCAQECRKSQLELWKAIEIGPRT